MLGFLGEIGETLGLVQKAVEPVCEHATDFACRYSDGAYSLSEYLPESVLDAADSVYGTFANWTALATLAGIGGVWFSYNSITNQQKSKARAQAAPNAEAISIVTTPNSLTVKLSIPDADSDDITHVTTTPVADSDEITHVTTMTPVRGKPKSDAKNESEDENERKKMALAVAQLEALMGSLRGNIQGQSSSGGSGSSLLLSPQAIVASGKRGTLSQPQSSFVPGVDIMSFKDNNDVNALIKIYEQAYLEETDHQALVGRFQNRPILMTPDKALFQVIPYVEVHDLKPSQSVGNGLAEWATKMIAFHLLTGQKVLPHELRTAMMVNHQNGHWTVVNASFKVDEATQLAYQRMQKLYASHNPLHGAPIIKNYAALNNAMNFVKAFMMEAPKDDKLIVDEVSVLDAIAMNIASEKFKGLDADKLPFDFSSVEVIHRDSMNHGSCHGRVYKALQGFLASNKGVNYEYEDAPQQLGNTCADHASFMGIKDGIFQEPILEADSYALRTHTELLNDRIATQRLLETQYATMTDFEVEKADIVRARQLLGRPASPVLSIDSKF